jgi:hypothetical protein
VPLQNRVNLGELLADGTVSSNTPVKAAATDKSDRERWGGLLALSTNRILAARWSPGNGDVADKSAN